MQEPEPTRIQDNPETCSSSSGHLSKADCIHQIPDIKYPTANQNVASGHFVARSIGGSNPAGHNQRQVWPRDLAPETGQSRQSDESNLYYNTVEVENTQQETAAKDQKCQNGKRVADDDDDAVEATKHSMRRKHHIAAPEEVNLDGCTRFNPAARVVAPRIKHPSTPQDLDGTIPDELRAALDRAPPRNLKASPFLLHESAVQDRDVSTCGASARLWRRCRRKMSWVRGRW